MQLGQWWTPAVTFSNTTLALFTRVSLARVSSCKCRYTRPVPRVRELAVATSTPYTGILTPATNTGRRKPSPLPAVLSYRYPVWYDAVGVRRQTVVSWSRGEGGGERQPVRVVIITTASSDVGVHLCLHANLSKRRNGAIP